MIDIQCCGINWYVKVYRNRRQFELKIVRRIPDLGAFEEALEAIPDTQQLVLPLLPQTPRTSGGMSVAFIDEIRQMTVISLGLRR